MNELENSKFAVTPQEVVQKMMSRLGKVNVCQVGWAAVGAAMVGLVGRNIGPPIRKLIRVIK